MQTTEPDTIAELIADCAQIPTSVRESPSTPPIPRRAAAWEVTDSCRAQVDDLDEYV
jgi:hypothetical protein